MNEEDKKSIIAFENFLKKTKGDKIQIKQPIKIEYQDIFSDEEKDKTLDNKNKKVINNKNILKSKKYNNNFIKTKKYNIVKESIVFQELDAKKSISNISNSKEEFSNSLYNSMINNNKLNFSENFIYNKKTDYIRRKSTINLEQLYELKLKNVRKVYIKYYNFIK